MSALLLEKYSKNYLLALRIDKKQTTFEEEKKKQNNRTNWLSATLCSFFYAPLLALSHSGRHERTTACTLLLCAGPIGGCSAVLAVRTVDTAAAAFGAWYVCAHKKRKFKNKKKVRGVVQS